MASSGTHIRFALDLQERLGVTDETAYLSGALYPDSRYLTKVSRAQTHRDPDVPTDPFAPDLSDFQKGWATHVLYDDRAGNMLRDLFDIGDKKIEFESEAYFHVTAAKMIEDLRSVKVLGTDLEKLQKITVVDRPYQEPEDKIEAWYKLQRKVYVSPPASFDDYALVWEVAPWLPREQVQQEFDRQLQDQELIDTIHAMYDKALSSL